MKKLALAALAAATIACTARSAPVPNCVNGSCSAGATNERWQGKYITKEPLNTPRRLLGVIAIFDKGVLGNVPPASITLDYVLKGGERKPIELVRDESGGDKRLAYRGVLELPEDNQLVTVPNNLGFGTLGICGRLCHMLHAPKGASAQFTARFCDGTDCDKAAESSERSIGDTIMKSKESLAEALHTHLEEPNRPTWLP